MISADASVTIARALQLRWAGPLSLQRLFAIRSIGTVYRPPESLWQCMHNAGEVVRFVEGAMFARLEGCTAYGMVRAPGSGQ